MVVWEEEAMQLNGCKHIAELRTNALYQVMPETKATDALAPFLPRAVCT